MTRHFRCAATHCNTLNTVHFHMTRLLVCHFHVQHSLVMWKWHTSCATTHSYVCHTSSTCLHNLFIRVPWHQVSAANTGWRRLIGSPELQIIFHKRATKYRSLLQKMTYKDKGSYGCWPPCSLLTHMDTTFHQMCAMTYLYVCGDSCIFVAQPHSYVCHDTRWQQQRVFSHTWIWHIICVS